MTRSYLIALVRFFILTLEARHSHTNFVTHDLNSLYSKKVYGLTLLVSERWTSGFDQISVQY